MGKKGFNWLQNFFFANRVKFSTIMCNKMWFSLCFGLLGSRQKKDFVNSTNMVPSGLWVFFVGGADGDHVLPNIYSNRSSLGLGCVQSILFSIDTYPHSL